MGVGIRLAAGAIVLALWSVLWSVRGAEAEPPESCRNLAARFASAPEELDVKALATLGSCLATEIAVRVGATGPSAASSGEAPTPSAPQEEVAPPPPPQEGASQPQTRRYGDWPAPPAWMERWPSPNPW